MSLLLLLLWACTLSSLGPSSVVYAIPVDNDTIPIPLARFDFTMDQCHNGTFPNQMNPPLGLLFSRNSKFTACSLSMGIERDTMTTRSSEEDEPPLYLSISADTVAMSSLLSDSLRSINAGVSIELWFQVLRQPEDSLPHPILTLKRPNRKAGDSGEGQTNDCDKQNIDFQLRQVGTHLEILFRTSDVIFEPCIRYRLATIDVKDQGMNHLLVSLGDAYQQLYLNGKPSGTLQEPFRNDLRHWGDLKEISFFSQGEYPPWFGRILRFSVFGLEFRNREDDVGLLAKGLPSSEPFPLQQTVTFDEFQGRENTFVTPNIDLGIIDISLEVDSLIRSLNLTQDVPRLTRYLYMTSFPLLGCIFDASGRNVTGSMGSAILLEGDRLLYIPPLNGHSDFQGALYTSFEFCVTSKLIYSPSQCTSAKISIIIDPINDPPEAVFSPGIVSVYEGELTDQSQIVALGGTDVDEGDYISRIQITSSPMFGELILSVGAFRDDGLVHGTRLLDINQTVAGSEVFLEYVYVGNGRPVQSGSTIDSFSFRVADRFGLWSEEIVVPLHILPAVAVVPMHQTIPEDDGGHVYLKGHDLSNLNRTIGFIIESVPDVSHGFLSSSNITETKLKKGDLVDGYDTYPYDQGVAISVVPSRNFCSSKSPTNMTFSYRIVALENDNITSISETSKQVVEVVCVPDPLVISVPSNQYEIQLFQNYSDNSCSGYVFNSDDIQTNFCKDAAVIEGIHVISVDGAPEDAFVSLSAEHGLLTLNRNYWAEVTKATDQLEMRPLLEFYASPNRLDDILSYLHFLSFVPGDDTILIDVRYGDCTSSQSIDSPDCYQTTTEIHIHVADRLPPLRTAYLFRRFQWVPLPFSVALLSFIKFRGLSREITLKRKKEQMMIEEERLANTAIEENSPITYERE
jgi:hypothetical protein